MNATQRVSSGYNKKPKELEKEREARRQELASRFKENAQMETLLKLRDNGSAITANQRLSLANYESARHAFNQTGEFAPV